MSGTDNNPPPQPKAMGQLGRDDASLDSTFVILAKDTGEGAGNFRPVITLVPIRDAALQLLGDFQAIDVDLSGLARRVGLETRDFDYCLGVRRGEAVDLVRQQQDGSPFGSRDAE